MVQRVTEVCRALELRLILDPAPAQPLPDGAWSGVFAVKPNETEAAILTGQPVTDQPSAERAARWFLDRGVEVAVITLGSRGALAVSGDTVQVLPAFAVRAVDTTAAGDAFTGAFGAGAGRRAGDCPTRCAGPSRPPRWRSPYAGPARACPRRRRSMPSCWSTPERSSARPMITVAALSPSLDLTYLVDTLAVGQIHRTAEPIAVAGGKALNMARAARSMGAECLAVALLGGPTGRQIAELMADEGLDLVPIESGVNTRTCVSIGATSTGELTELYAEAAPVGSAALPALIDAVDDLLPDRPGWLSMSGRTPGGDAHAVARLVDLAHQHGVRVAVDTHSEALPEAVAHRPDLIKINRVEAAQLLDRPADTDLVEMATLISARSRRTGGADRWSARRRGRHRHLGAARPRVSPTGSLPGRLGRRLPGWPGRGPGPRC